MFNTSWLAESFSNRDLFDEALDAHAGCASEYGDGCPEAGIYIGELEKRLAGWLVTPPPVIRFFQYSYGWLSNFELANGFKGATLEHDYQAAKTTDVKLRTRILNAPSPALAKSYTKKAVLPVDWDTFKFTVMRNLVHVKFSWDYNPKLAHKLLMTGESIIEEGNTWHDLVWGRCWCKIHNGDGENHLGKLLMQRRKELE